MIQSSTVVLPDPNWLLSTSAQSAAAIVAIVAGFLASRLLSIAAERGGVKARLAEVAANLSFRKNELAEIQRKVDEINAYDFIKGCLPTIVETKGYVELESLKEIAPPGPTEEELRDLLNSARASTKRAFKFFRRDHPLQEDPPATVQEYLEQINETIPPHDYDEDTYPLVYQFLRREHRSDRRQRSSALWGPKYLPAGLPPYEERSAAFRQLDQDRLALDREFKWLTRQRDSLASDLAGLKTPRSLWVGIGVLIYFSAVGILVPLAWMPASPDQFTAGAWWLEFGLFASGLTAVLLYLFVSMLQMSEVDLTRFIRSRREMTNEPALSEAEQRVINDEATEFDGAIRTLGKVTADRQTSKRKQFLTTVGVSAVFISIFSLIYLTDGHIPLDPQHQVTRLGWLAVLLTAIILPPIIGVLTLVLMRSIGGQILEKSGGGNSKQSLFVGSGKDAVELKRSLADNAKLKTVAAYIKCEADTLSDNINLYSQTILAVGVLATGLLLAFGDTRYKEVGAITGALSAAVLYFFRAYATKRLGRLRYCQAVIEQAQQIDINAREIAADAATPKASSEIDQANKDDQSQAGTPPGTDSVSDTDVIPSVDDDTEVPAQDGGEIQT